MMRLRHPRPRPAARILLLFAPMLALMLCGFGYRQAGAATSPARNDLSEAMGQFRENHYRRAARLFARIEALTPGRGAALLWLAKCRINLGLMDEAGDDLETYLHHHPRSDDALSLLGYVLFRRGHPRQSLRIFARAAVLQAPLGDDYKIRGLDYIALRQWTPARRELRHAVKLEPGNLQAQFYLAWMEYIANHFTRARKRLKTLMRREPRNVAAATLLGLTLEAQSHYRQATAEYLRAIHINERAKRRSAQPYIGYGILLERLGHPRQAMSQLHFALTLKPTSFRAHAHLGHIELMLNHLPEAERELRTALRLNPRYRPAYYQLAQIYRREGKPQLAQQAMRRLTHLPAGTVPH